MQKVHRRPRYVWLLFEFLYFTVWGLQKNFRHLCFEWRKVSFLLVFLPRFQPLWRLCWLSVRWNLLDFLCKSVPSHSTREKWQEPAYLAPNVSPLAGAVNLGVPYDLRLETASVDGRLWDFNSHHGSVDSLWISICTCWILPNLFDIVCTFHLSTMRSIPLIFKWLLPGKNVQALTRRVSSGNLHPLQRAQLCWWWPWQIDLFRAEQHIESGSIEVVLWKMWYCNVVYCCVFLWHVFWRSTKSAPFWLHTRMLSFSSGCLLILFDQNQHESTAICGMFLQNDFPDYSKHYDISRLSFDPGIAVFLRKILEGELGVSEDACNAGLRTDSLSLQSEVRLSSEISIPRREKDWGISED